MVKVRNILKQLEKDEICLHIALNYEYIVLLDKEGEYQIFEAPYCGIEEAKKVVTENTLDMLISAGYIRYDEQIDFASTGRLFLAQIQDIFLIMKVLQEIVLLSFESDPVEEKTLDKEYNLNIL